MQSAAQQALEVEQVSDHPLAGQEMTGSDIIVQVLAQEETDVIFGYSGGAILPTYDAVFRYNKETNDSMPLIVPANEQGAGFMASGYARASGKVGVVMVTSGPGATNTVTPVRDCMADSIPIVVICGQVPTAATGSCRWSAARAAAHRGSRASWPACDWHRHPPPALQPTDAPRPAGPAPG